MQIKYKKGNDSGINSITYRLQLNNFCNNELNYVPTYLFIYLNISKSVIKLFHLKNNKLKK